MKVKPNVMKNSGRHKRPMQIVLTDGTNKDFYGLCVKLDASLNANAPGRKEAGLNSLYDIQSYKHIFLMYDGAKPIGSAGLWQHDAKVCELIRVYIEDDYRGQGLAGELIERVEQLAIEKGYLKVMLRTWSSTPYAVRAYEKFGFKKVAASKIKYPDKFSPALALAKIRVYMEKELV